jgi:Domain of unknown function (DUF3416)
VTAKASIRSIGGLSKHRIYIEDVYPVVDGGRFPVKRIVGEEVDVWADIFRDGACRARGGASVAARRSRQMAPRSDGAARQRPLDGKLHASQGRTLRLCHRGLVPRSQVFGKHGTFDNCINRLPDIAAMGFGVLYLTPIHPIGRVNRGFISAISRSVHQPRAGKLIENLVTGERHIIEWGGVRLRIDQQQDPALLFRCLT